MNLCVPFKIMLPYKTLVAVRALELSVSEMSLHMGLDVFFSTEALAAVRIQAKPSGITWIGRLNISRDVINGNTGVCNGFL